MVEVEFEDTSHAGRLHAASTSCAMAFETSFDEKSHVGIALDACNSMNFSTLGFIVSNDLNTATFDSNMLEL